MTTTINVSDQEKPSSNTDNSMDVVLDMNTRGVHLLQANRFDDAMTIFREALTELRRQKLASEVTEATETFSSCYDKFPGALDSSKIVSFPDVPCTTIDQIDSYLMFARPLGLGSEDSSNIDVDLLSGILVFNTGLIRHLQGSKSGKADIVLQALKLYKIAFSVFANRETADTSLALMAIINNSGHAFLLLGRNHEAQECREELAVCLQGEAQNCLTEEEQLIFEWNLYFYDPKNKTVLASPAA